MEVKRFIKSKISKPGMGQVYTVTVGLVILCIGFGIINPRFFSGRNISNLLRQIAPIILIGVGQSFVLITGNIDLSIGSVVGVSTMLSATLLTKGMHPLPAVIITILVSLAFGVLNGYLVAGFKLPPFIATLGTMTIGRGIAQIVNGNYNTGAINTIPETATAVDTFRNVFYYGRTLTVYNGVWIALAIFLILNFFLNRTRSGRYLYALGSNPEAARLSGVNVLKTTIIAYTVSAFCI